MNKLFEILEKNDFELPGAIAHSAMAPKFNEALFRSTKPKENSRKSAIIIPLFDSDSNIIEGSNDIAVLISRRSLKLKNHPGQLCFPGGGLDKNETPIKAAIRELEEEVGIKEKNIDFLCSLSKLFVEPSNNIIYPFVCRIKSNEINIYPEEVDSIYFKELNFFLDPINIKYQKRIMESKEILIPFWDIGSEVPLWGASAMIMNEFVELVKSF